MTIFPVKRFVVPFVTALALAASTGAVGVGLQRGQAASENAPWYDTNGNAAASRANLNEQVLTPAAVPKIRYLRSVVSPLTRPSALCPGSVVAPVLVGGYLYVVTNDTLSKYAAATGALMWRVTPDPTFSSTYESLAISGNLVIVGSYDCQDPPIAGEVFAFNASTGVAIWNTGFASAAGVAVVEQSYVISFNDNGEGQATDVLNVKDGSLLWSDSGCADNGGQPLVVGELVITYGCDSQGGATIQASTLANGTAVWSLPGNWTLQRGDISGTTGMHLYATNPSGNVVDLNPLKGKTVYSLSGAVNVLAVDASRVYTTCGSGGTSICGYNISTGALLWQNQSFFAAPPLVAAAAGVLYLDSGEALNAATGQLIKKVWESPSSPSATALAVGDGRIAVVSDPRVLDLFGLKGY